MQRKFRIRESVLREGKNPFEDNFGALRVPDPEPLPDIVWIRYMLTMKAMDKRFDDTQTMLAYVLDLEDFIYSAAGSSEKNGTG